MVHCYLRSTDEVSHPDVSRVDEGDEVRIVRTHCGVQTGPGGLGLQTGTKIFTKIYCENIYFAHLDLIREERPRVSGGGV